jgi:hypothetical protein
MRFALAILFFPLAATAAEKLRFNRDIRPILSDKCFHCHGPDAKKREADLRLDDRAAAIKDGHIVPGKPEKSLILDRILTSDPDELMPPPKSKLGQLTKAEVETLRRWISEGAEYEAHWSFTSFLIPESRILIQDAAKRVDEIVSAGLAQRGLKLQPRAEASTLRRRLHFDLIGLPPSDWSDKSDVSDLMPVLLKSPSFGEKWASDWLDVSRYADSYGFQVDRERDVWPWRDWVVKALNENLPFDQFVTWQIAGDLLPKATDEQILATAFNRLHQQEAEGGSVEEEYRVEYVADRVQTFATAFLGLTFECARCHDHKYDPIAQKEYYGLFSMFQNIDEAGLYSFFTPSPPTPTLMMMDEPTKAKLVDAKAKVAALEKKLPKHLTKPDLEHGEIARFSFDKLEKNTLANVVDPKSPATLKGENKLVAGHEGQAVQFTGDDAVDTKVGNFQRHEPFSVSLWMQTPDVKERAVVFHRSRAWTDAASRGYELLIEEGKLKWSLIHFWPGNAISIRTKQAIPLKTWLHVVVTNDGSSRADGLRIFIDGKQATVDIIRDNLTKNILGGGGDTISLGERFRDRGFKGGLIDDFRVFSRDVTLPHDLKFDELTASRAEVTKLLEAQKEMMVMRELPQPKKAYTLIRGEYDKRGEEVAAVTPAVLPPMKPEWPQNRLGLAKWLTAPNHPLLARVTVNRIWASLFGRGLVKTSEDFGSQGERPLYPELLDFLAGHFIASGWDVKGLIHTIVSSQTYQQRSLADAATMADDPDNQWLARGPRHRLSAEMIRDNALAISGLLQTQVGGPPVYPYEMTEAFKPIGPSAGDAVFRRSLYTTWRRTSPPPAMLAFDAPRRAVCTAKRERTDSPLQALILLNGPQFVEAARVLAEKLLAESKGDTSKLIDSAFLHCLSRKPEAKELFICQQLYAEQLAHFTKDAAAAKKLLDVGTRKPKTPSAGLAAAAVLVQALMNHDECVVKR